MLSQVVAHTPQAARYSCSCSVRRATFLVAGPELIPSLQGTQQGDPVGMLPSALALQPDRTREPCDLDLNLLRADDGTPVGYREEVARLPYYHDRRSDPVLPFHG